jgi:hypothetical protein
MKSKRRIPKKHRALSSGALVPGVQRASKVDAPRIQPKAKGKK